MTLPYCACMAKYLGFSPPFFGVYIYFVHHDLNLKRSSKTLAWFEVVVGLLISILDTQYAAGASGQNRV
jgi:hypothetical protein